LSEYYDILIFNCRVGTPFKRIKQGNTRKIKNNNNTTIVPEGVIPKYLYMYSQVPLKTLFTIVEFIREVHRHLLSFIINNQCQYFSNCLFFASTWIHTGFLWVCVGHRFRLLCFYLFSLSSTCVFCVQCFLCLRPVSFVSNVFFVFDLCLLKTQVEDKENIGHKRHRSKTKKTLDTKDTGRRQRKHWTQKTHIRFSLPFI
jgi:hypothetical protein